jgi:hypothetical protein
MRRVALVAVVCATVGAAVAFGVLRSRDHNSPQPPDVWPVARAESRIASAPPPVWVHRHWDVAYVACDGVGRTRTDGDRRLYRRFSCDITVVRPSGDCASSGLYLCVAGFESTVLTRTLRVLDADRYALS